MNKVEELNEVEQDLALSQVCTTGGSRRKEFVYTCLVCVCSLCVCMCVCAHECVELPNWPPVFPSL